MGDPRRHHYVPAYYQRNFCRDGVNVVYDRKTGIYKPLPPASVCVTRDFYAIGKDGEKKNQAVEQEYLARVDAIGADTIRQVAMLVPGLPPEGLLHRIGFVAGHQVLRSPAQRKLVDASFAHMARRMAQTAFATPERARATMEQVRGRTGRAADAISAEDMVEYVQAAGFDIAVSEAPFLKFLVTRGRDYVAGIHALSCELLQAPDGTGFIFSDHPFVVVGDPVHGHRGIHYPGTVKYFPITRDLCMRYGDLGTGRAYRSINRALVRVINLNVAANSDRFIIGPDETQLRAIVERSQTTEMDDGERFTLTDTGNAIDGGFIILQNRGGRNFYPQG